MGDERGCVHTDLGGHPLDKGDMGALCWVKLTSPLSGMDQDAMTQFSGVASKVAEALGRQAGWLDWLNVAGEAILKRTTSAIFVMAATTLICRLAARPGKTTHCFGSRVGVWRQEELANK